MDSIHYPTPAPHHGAVEICVSWLSDLHRKGWRNASLSLFTDLIPEQDRDKFANLDEETIEATGINMNEWLLAEGDIQARGGMRRINDYLLGPTGPQLSPAQRDWMQQLGQRPLRVYDVTDVVQGQQMTLCDALDQDAAPMVVRERSGTQNLQPGALLGCRVVRAGDHFEMSGCAYLFAPLNAPQVLSRLREQNQALAQLLNGPRQLGLVVMREWIQQWFKPAQLPQLIDHYSGEPMAMITDHYLVNDESALALTLATQPNIEGNRQEGWSRLMDCTDGQVRALVHINPGKKANQLELFYRTQRYADEGRLWFDATVGASVTFVKRAVQSTQDAVAKAQKPSARATSRKGKAAATSAPTLDAVTMTQLMTEAIHRFYAKWADEPIPALDNKTPRQAITTAAGLERVKGLLRSYEVSDVAQARQQGRAPVSYDFLWQSLGLTR
ncbi:MAG: zinc chelation protein SecC [Comamonadaceae bacterium CG12_big_fil_rev_8_21_14_0_65_59_15]|nr:MAG: zinc chelation protein SecC [Comamonadaceae bacterium CG12_big_fil_rev_8_21_14_0_65_59_15]